MTLLKRVLIRPSVRLARRFVSEEGNVNIAKLIAAGTIGIVSVTGGIDSLAQRKLHIKQ